jgi:hypothetical protein
LNGTSILQLLLDFPDQLFPLQVNRILGVEQFTPLGVAPAFKVTELLLVRQLVLQ